jgi:SAM-dependent methyltransferase
VTSLHNAEQEGLIVTRHGTVAFDPARPNIARVYDYWLGGKDNFPADRAEAERLLVIYPRLRECARENRQFLEQSVAWVAEQGVRQFLDVGSGLPTDRNTHEVARAVDSTCRVVYVDNDSVVLTHARALLRDDGVGTAAGDLTNPAAILANPDVRSQLRLDEPVGLILCLVLHFFDADAAREITAAFMRAVGPGSYVVISVGSADEETGRQLAEEYAAGRLHNHSPAQIAGFFAGLDLVGPGLTAARDWGPGPPARAHDHHGCSILAGVGLKP